MQRDITGDRRSLPTTTGRGSKTPFDRAVRPMGRARETSPGPVVSYRPRRSVRGCPIANPKRPEIPAAEYAVVVFDNRFPRDDSVSITATISRIGGSDRTVVVEPAYGRCEDASVSRPGGTPTSHFAI